MYTQQRHDFLSTSPSTTQQFLAIRRDVFAHVRRSVSLQAASLSQRRQQEGKTEMVESSSFSRVRFCRQPLIQEDRGNLLKRAHQEREQREVGILFKYEHGFPFLVQIIG